jgi:two-component system, NtrC family, response regulator HydG
MLLPDTRMASSSRLLIVDDDPDTRDTLGTVFSDAGHECELAADGHTALELVRRQRFSAILSDVVMDGMDGLELLARVKETHPALPVVLITAVGGVEQALEAVKGGAFSYLIKPCASDELQRVVSLAIQTRSGRGDGARIVQPLAPRAPPAIVDPLQLVGEAPVMKALRTAIEFLARSSAPVLVTGETGAGKELVARAIHARSARSGHPFVSVNTSAVPRELLEGEIFGHVRGSFTGAVQARKGLLTEADRGTLLLDEIGDMSFDLQAKLLRVLQFGDVRPVGSDREHHVDVRVIACTHRDLPALIQAGQFREDLYFRLNVLSVAAPPLRDHTEDIPALAAHFLAQARARAPSSPVRSLGPDALAVLAQRAWPGNVRELGSCIERAVVFGDDEIVDVRHLVGPVANAEAPGWPFPTHAPWTLDRLTRSYADWVLAQVEGDKARAAQILGIDLSTLYRWCRRAK